MIPVTVDVPFAAAMVGLRPAALPPLSKETYGVPIGHIQSGHWAERAGLKVGDVITHVNGRSVMDMQSGDEFIQDISKRPLRLTIQIAVSASEMSEMLQSFDWTSRFREVEKTRNAAGDPEQTDEMFNRLFGQSPEYDDISGLFDFSTWMGSGLRKSYDAPREQEPAPQPAIETPAAPPQPKEIPVAPKDPEPPRLPPLQPEFVKVEPVKMQRRLPTTRTVLKWVVSEPLCVWFKVDRGFDLPTKAGTLSLDYYLQPFSAEPYLELSLVASPAREVTVNEILDSKPVDPRAVAQTPICDYNSKWDYSGSLALVSSNFTEGSLMLVGKLLDYRRLEAPRPMGVFAIRLDAMDILDDLSKAKPTMVSLTLVDAYTFDVSKTKIRMQVCLRGRQIAHSENVKSPVRSVQASAATSPSLISSPTNSSIASKASTPPPEPVAPLIKTTTQPAPIVYRTPFQRAYRKALSGIRNGDKSPIHHQHYTLR